MNQTKQEKPEWLSKLEAESWQAELLISGIAIFGSFQLPYLLDKLVELAIVTVPVSDFTILYAFFVVLIMGVYIIIAGLLIHFILRAFWIGLVGFNSVYPNGLNKENDTFYSKSFLLRISEKLPKDSNSTIRALDNICSTIYSIIILGCLILLAMVIDVMLLYLLKLLLASFLPSSVISWFLIILGVVFYFFVILNVGCSV